MQSINRVEPQTVEKIVNAVALRARQVAALGTKEARVMMMCGSAQAGCFIGVARGFWGLMKVMQSCHVIAGGWGDILITLYLISIFGVNRFWFRRCLTADVGCWFGWTNVSCLQCLRLIWKRGSFSEFCVAAVD